MKGSADEACSGEIFCLEEMFNSVKILNIASSGIFCPTPHFKKSHRGYKNVPMDVVDLSKLSTSSLSFNKPSRYEEPSSYKKRRQDQSLFERKGLKQKLDEELEEERQISKALPTADERAAVLVDAAEQMCVLESTFMWNEVDRAATKRPTHALADLTKNEEVVNVIVEGGVILALILMLRSEDVAIHYEAVGKSSPLFSNIKKEVLLVGALQPVIGLLSSGSSESQREAALLLGQFAATDSDYKVHIVQRGVV